MKDTEVDPEILSVEIRIFEIFYRKVKTNVHLMYSKHRRRSQKGKRLFKDKNI